MGLGSPAAAGLALTRSACPLPPNLPADGLMTYGMMKAVKKPAAGAEAAAPAAAEQRVEASA